MAATIISPLVPAVCHVQHALECEEKGVVTTRPFVFYELDYLTDDVVVWGGKPKHLDDAIAKAKVIVQSGIAYYNLPMLHRVRNCGIVFHGDREQEQDGWFANPETILKLVQALKDANYVKSEHIDIPG